MAKHKGNELKEHIVKQVLKGTSIYSLAEQFEINKETIRRWVLRFQETGFVERHNRDSIAYKVTEAHLKFAKQYIENTLQCFSKT